MPDNSASANTVPKSDAPVSQSQPKPLASSPWEEELPEPEPPKEQVVGTLGTQKGNEPTGNAKPDAFVVPSNIDASVGPKVVSPGNFPNAITSAVPNQTQNKPSAQTAAPVPGNVNNKQTTSPFTYGVDLASSPPETITAKEKNPAPPAPSAAPMPNVTGPLNPSASLNPTPGLSTSLGAGPSTSLGAGNVITDIRPAANASSGQPNAQINPNNNLTPPEDKPSPISQLGKRIWPFAKKQNMVPEKPAAGLDGVSGQPAPTAVGDNTAEAQRRPSGKLKILKYCATGFAILSAAVFLTEFGILSIGLEKVYGAIGLETFWGGLPAKSDKALISSLMAMQEHPDFKIKGSLDLTVDKTKKSDITTPLTLSYIPIYERVTKAMLAVTDSDSDWSATDWAVDGSDSTDSSDTPASSVTDPSTSATSTPSSTSTTPTSSQTDQQNYQSYQNVGASTKEIQTTFDGFIGQTGDEIKFVVNKAVGNDKINLKNLDDKLWINSDNVIFGGNQDPTKWLEYKVKSLSGTLLNKEFFSGLIGGVSVKGARKANEKVGGVRCYKYEIKEIALGNSLSAISIKSDSVQTITGNVWIGIKDKLIRKIDIKITLAPSYPITQLTLNLDLHDYDVINNFVKVLSTEIYQPATAGTSAITSTATAVTSAGSSAEIADAKRKSDLVLIQNALELYKEHYYSYPTASVLVKLNTANNILEKLLTPGYISALPKDAKDADGWFYGYKSAGTSYTLSARLENTSDPAAVLTDGFSLYFLKNQ